MPASPPPASTSARFVSHGRQFDSTTTESVRLRFPRGRRHGHGALMPGEIQPAEAPPEPPSWALPRAVVVMLGLAAAVVVIAGP